MMGKWGWALCASLIMALAAAAEVPVRGGVEGRLTKATGTVHVERDGQTLPAEPGMEVQGGDVIVTEARSEAAVDLGDSRTITVKERSQFSMDERGPEREAVSSGILHYGLIRVFRPPGGRTAQFQVQTPTAVAGVRGTNFGVAVAPDGGSRFGVEEGEVSVEAEGGETSTLGAMQEVVVDMEAPGRLRAQPYDPGKQSLENWQKQRLDQVLKNPIPAVQRLTFNIAAMVSRGTRALMEARKSLNQTLQVVQKARETKLPGRNEIDDRQRARIFALHKELVTLIRQLVRIDNGIIARKRLLNVILAEATAEGSPTPHRQVNMIEQNLQRILMVEEEAKKVHQGRAHIMRVKIPELRQALSDLN